MRDGLLAVLGRSDLCGGGQGHDLVQVDGRPAIEHSPHEAGELEEEGHEHEDDRHPLVVGQLLRLAPLLFQGDGVAHGDIVGVLHPAVRPGVDRTGIFALIMMKPLFMIC